MSKVTGKVCGGQVRGEAFTTFTICPSHNGLKSKYFLATEKPNCEDFQTNGKNVFIPKQMEKEIVLNRMLRVVCGLLIGFPCCY